MTTLTPSARHLLVDQTTKAKPKIVDRLNDWQYLERTAHRLLAAWGRHMADWEGKSALHRHVWDQAECVRRLRERVEQFPGGKPDAVVSPLLETLGNALLHAPSFDDALDGIYRLLLKALVAAYVDYTGKAHAVHDAPTVAVLHEINQIKSQQWLWYRDYRRAHPHVTDADYEAKVAVCIKVCGEFREALPVAAGEAARPCGVGSGFRLPKFSARTFPAQPKADFMPYVRADFRTSLEARRLFWAYAYMLEKNLPDDQLAWLYYGHDLPWAWHHDVSRHLWDESRHGDSGYSRLKDFGIAIEEVGFPAYNNDEKMAALAGRGAGSAKAYEDELADIPMEPMGPAQLYEAVFFIGMVAENGHFIVKQEAYQDFKDGQDLESAEMMLFDIIDETTHVQYAHRWLPLLAEKAGIDNSGYRERASKMRADSESGENGAIAALSLDRDPANPAYAFYQELLGRIRASYPLANADTCPVRSAKPM
jgi:hypothetical protein